MPELVTCPRCGCGMQVPELRVGLRARCIACGEAFTAGAPAAPPEETSYPVQGPLDGPPSPDPRPLARGVPRNRMPLCPACHRPVGWEALTCPHCGHAFDPLEAARGGSLQGRRRDDEEHRGGAIDVLGTLSLLAGALALLTGPITGLVALATGIPAVVMANRDLEQMRLGAIDPAGRDTTRAGRSRALLGVGLGAVGSIGGIILFVAYHW